MAKSAKPVKPWTHAETKRRIVQLFGEEQAADRAAAALGLGKSGRRTVFRWMSGEVTITGPAQLALDLLGRCPPDSLPPHVRPLMTIEG